MARKPTHIENDDDFDSVEISPDLARAQEEEARKAAAASADDDDDDDDFDLLGEDDGVDGLGAGADDDDDEDDADGEGDGGEDDDDDEPSLTRVPKVARKDRPKSKAQERIEELAAKRREAEEAAFKADMELIKEREARKALEERIAALESGTAKPVSQSVEKPDPEKFKYGEVDPEYIDAMVEYRLAKERDKFQREQDTRRSEEETERQKEHYKARLAKVTEEGNKKFKDFDAIVNRVDFPGQIAIAVLDSEYGVDIAYYLGKNIGKLREMTFMTPEQRMRAMGRLEERFSARASAGKKRSKAPETPGRKVKRGKPAQDAKYGPDDQDEFDKAFYGR